MGALSDWAAMLADWDIPKEILARAPESPWGFPKEMLGRKGLLAADHEPAPSARRALEALPEAGSVLDIGCGGGAASLPLAERASTLIGVDPSEELLDEFVANAAEIEVAAEGVIGTWPDVASSVSPADVVVCNNVLYNVRDLAPFANEMTRHAWHRVVVEITGEHPLAWMSDLWMRFHGIERPTRPTVEDCVEALKEIGISPNREDDIRADYRGGFEEQADAIALIRRRLCLEAEQDGDVAEALGERIRESHGLWSAGPVEWRVTTLWWDGQIVGG
jgi:SAM-dependent methyltransferase